MAEDGGESSVCLGDGEESRVDSDFAAWEGEGVRCRVFEDDEFPVSAWHVDGFFEFCSDAFDLSVVGWVCGDAFCSFDGFELLGASLG